MLDNNSIVDETEFNEKNPTTEIVNNKWYGKELKSRGLGIICNNLGILGTSFLFKDGVIANPIAAVTFGLADFCFLINDYLHIMTDNSLNAQSNYFKFTSEALTTVPSLALIPTAVALFNTPFPTDKYIRYHIAMPFISATALGGLATVIDKSIKIYDYCAKKNDVKRHEYGYRSINVLQTESEDNKTSSKMVLFNMAKITSNLSIIAVTSGLMGVYLMSQEQNDKNPENHNLTGFYLLAAPVLYNSVKATASLVSSSYRGAKTILAKASSWCTSKNEETAALVNSYLEADVIQEQQVQSRTIAIY